MSQSPEGPSYLCNEITLSDKIYGRFCLNHPKALLISATGIPSFAKISGFISLNHPKALLISATLLMLLMMLMLMLLMLLMLLLMRLNHPKALLISATDAHVGRVAASAVSQSPEGSSYLCN